MIFSRKLDLITIGDSMIDTFLFMSPKVVKIDPEGPRASIAWGEKLPVESYHKSVAGNGINNVIGASRLGLHSAFYTIVGDDVGGREITHKLKKEGVNLDYLIRSKESQTSASVVLSVNAERSIFVYHYKREYEFPKLKKSSWIYLTSMASGCEKIYPKLVKWIKQNNISLGYNPGTHQLIAGVDKSKKILQVSTFISVNKEEAISWVGPGSSLELCQKLAALGPKIIVLTDGRKGAYAYTAGELWYIREFPGKRFEATGAGDSFTSAFLSALHYKQPVSEALVWGAINAMKVVGQIGPIAGLQTKKELLSLRKSHRNFKAKKI